MTEAQHPRRSANQTKAEHTNELITSAVWFQPFLLPLGNNSHPSEWGRGMVAYSAHNPCKSLLENTGAS